MLVSTFAMLSLHIKSKRANSKQTVYAPPTAYLSHRLCQLLEESKSTSQLLAYSSSCGRMKVFPTGAGSFSSISINAYLALLLQPSSFGGTPLPDWPFSAPNKSKCAELFGKTEKTFSRMLILVTNLGIEIDIDAPTAVFQTQLPRVQQTLIHMF